LVAPYKPSILALGLYSSGLVTGSCHLYSAGQAIDSSKILLV